MHQHTNNIQSQLNIIDDINVKNADICSRMEIKIKGLIFILDSYILSLELDKCFKEQHIYLQFGMSNLNTLLDLLLKDNSKLEENQEHIFKILKQLD